MQRALSCQYYDWRADFVYVPESEMEEMDRYCDWKREATIAHMGWWVKHRRSDHLKRMSDFFDSYGQPKQVHRSMKTWDYGLGDDLKSQFGLDWDSKNQQVVECTDLVSDIDEAEIALERIRSKTQARNRRHRAAAKGKRVGTSITHI